MNLVNGRVHQRVPCNSVDTASDRQIGIGWGSNPLGGLRSLAYMIVVQPFRFLVDSPLFFNT